MTQRRVIAERIRTGEILSWNVPLLGGGATRELSGPGGITGMIAPRNAALLGPDKLPLLREWSTALHYEVDGRIDTSGIITRLTEDRNGALTIEAPGYSTYPHGVVHARTYKADVGADVLDVYRYLWNYVQGYPDGNLGITVDPLVSKVPADGNIPINTGGRPVTPDNPQFVLPWHEYVDCGEEMDNLLEQASADYIEKHAWNADHTGFTHHIALGVPRLGKKRRDLRFVEGENIVEAVPLVISGDDFAQNIYAAGRGEGPKMRVAKVLHTDPDRLRRTALVIDKSAGDSRLLRLARREYQRRNDTKAFDSVVIKDHPNARITDIDPGDDILVEANLSWYGPTRLWCRVLSIEVALDGDETALLKVARSDAFRY